MRGISKRYGELLANDAIDLSIRPGEIHALLGENGAGKSTLVKILYGVVEPSAGEIVWEGRPVTIASPVEARALGIGMVFQHFSLFDELTVAENIAVALSDEWTLDDRSQRARRDLRTYGLALDADRAVWTLSAGERQRIEIVRCLLQGPRLLILDEPTSVLTPQEAEHLFVDARQAVGRGRARSSTSPTSSKRCAVSARRATILRGRTRGRDHRSRASSAREIAALMVGNEVGEVRSRCAASPGRRDAAGSRLCPCRPPACTGSALPDINLVAHAGEVVGIAGVAGNGQSELFAALSGERLADRDEPIMIAGRPAALPASTRGAGSGAAFVPEERLGHAAAPTHRLSENTLISHAAAEVSRSGFILARRGASGSPARSSRASTCARRRAIRRRANCRAETCRNSSSAARSSASPKLLIVDQPTWGVDAGAARLIRQALVDLARAGQRGRGRQPGSRRAV